MRRSLLVLVFRWLWWVIRDVFVILRVGLDICLDTVDFRTLTRVLFCCSSIGRGSIRFCLKRCGFLFYTVLSLPIVLPRMILLVVLRLMILLEL